MEKVVAVTSAVGIYESLKQGALLSDELLCGMSAELLEHCAGGMLRIRTGYGYQGYAAGTGFVSDDGQWERTAKSIVTGSYINVQQQPAVRSIVLVSLPRGSLVSAEGPSVEGWQPVRVAGGQCGYVQSVHLSEYPIGTGLDNDELRKSICKSALSYMGCCYRWGGKTPLGIDCSGLCSQVYLNHGIVIHRDAKIADGFAVKKIDIEELRPADLLYWKGHIALWLGDGRYIHSSASSGGVTVNSIVKGEADYREDLAKTIIGCGSVFCG